MKNEIIEKNNEKELIHKVSSPSNNPKTVDQIIQNNSNKNSTK